MFGKIGNTIAVRSSVNIESGRRRHAGRIHAKKLNDVVKWIQRGRIRLVVGIHMDNLATRKDTSNIPVDRLGVRTFRGDNCTEILRKTADEGGALGERETTEAVCATGKAIGELAGASDDSNSVVGGVGKIDGDILREGVGRSDEVISRRLRDDLAMILGDYGSGSLSGIIWTDDIRGVRLVGDGFATANFLIKDICLEANIILLTISFISGAEDSVLSPLHSKNKGRKESEENPDDNDRGKIATFVTGDTAMAEFKSLRNFHNYFKYISF